MLEEGDQKKIHADDIAGYLDTLWLKNLNQQRSTILSKLEKSDPTVKKQ